MKVIIIDDEVQAIRNLEQLISDYVDDIEIIGRAQGVKEGVRLINNLNPDTILLDIQMQDGSGFDLLKFFPQPNFNVIFVTAFDEFALRAFRYNAIDYLLKPVDPIELKKALGKGKDHISHTQRYSQLDELMKVMNTNSFKKLAVTYQDDTFYIDVEDIICLEAFKNYTTIHQENQKYVVSKSLGEYEEILSDEFFRCHKSYIINLHHVKRHTKKDASLIILSNEMSIPLARRKKEVFHSKMQTIAHK